MIDDKAHELRMRASLSVNFTNYFVKSKFFNDKKDSFNMFDSVER